MVLPLLTSSVPLDPDAFHFRSLTAASPAMRRLFSRLESLATTPVSLLLSGEVGVGKERVARALHAASGADGELVVVDAGALRASSDAEADVTSGLAYLARASRGGTLFVRDVDLLPPSAQELLVRLEPTARGRLVASTTRSLEDDVAHGRFSAALYDLVAAARLYVPPLRHRPEDVPVLARTFAHEAGGRPLPPAVVSDLTSREWRGNVAELRETVSRLVKERIARDTAGGVTEEPDAAALALDEALATLVDVEVPYATLKEQLVARFTRIYLVRLLEHTNHNRSKAARLAQLDRTYLGRLVEKLGVTFT